MYIHTHIHTRARAHDLNKITESLRNKLKIKTIELRNLENL